MVRVELIRGACYAFSPGCPCCTFEVADAAVHFAGSGHLALGAFGGEARVFISS